MGEAVLSSEEMELVKNTATTTTTAATEEKKDGLVKWERFLPKMALRVLLVEADDCTRQIVSALLRKSSYTVNAVPDGLKAWEILKGRPENIDIILTEVDLPSISGFALLTLIMEHEICKNIPVIMMSAQDSVSTVYKCMLRGAADYLVKPVRRNELRNLWQHVWRRQSTLAGGNSAQDESVGQKKIEASSDNDAASNRSSGYMACVQRDEECIEKGSDAQSSCTKPDFEAESAHTEDTLDLSMQLGHTSLPDDIVKMQMHKSYVNYGQKLQSEAGGSGGAVIKDANRENASLGKDVEPENQRKDLSITSKAGDFHVSSSTDVIDFMGSLTNLRSSSNNCTGNFGSSSQLDLSLRRSHPSGSEIQVPEQKFTLGHSNASAFTRESSFRYTTNRSSQPLSSALTSAHTQHKEYGSEKNVSNIGITCNSDTPVPVITTQRSITSLATNHSKQSEPETPCPRRRVCTVQVPVEGMRLNNGYNGYGSVIPHMFYAQSGPSPSPSSANQQEPAFQMNSVHCSAVENGNCAQLYDRLGENANQTMQRLDSLEDWGHISPAPDQSASSSFCNGAISRLNSMGGYGSTCGSNSNIDQGAVGRAAAESKNEEVFITSSGNSHRAIQREAALTKFRMKRKDRCYEKKVRYESRKKLAEQRPRVKGQFVRQMQTDSAPAESENHGANSLD